MKSFGCAPILSISRVALAQHCVKMARMKLPGIGAGPSAKKKGASLTKTAVKARSVKVSQGPGRRKPVKVAGAAAPPAAPRAPREPGAKRRKRPGRAAAKEAKYQTQTATKVGTKNLFALAPFVRQVRLHMDAVARVRHTRTRALIRSTFNSQSDLSLFAEQHVSAALKPPPHHTRSRGAAARCRGACTPSCGYVSIMQPTGFTPSHDTQDRLIRIVLVATANNAHYKKGTLTSHDLSLAASTELRKHEVRARASALCCCVRQQHAAAAKLVARPRRTHRA